MCYCKWWRQLLLLLFTFSPLHLLISSAQEMHVNEFAKLKKGPLNMNHVVTNKQQAILDLKTSEKGFTFLADGKQAIQAEEGDGIVTLKTIPHGANKSKVTLLAQFQKDLPVRG